MARGAQLVPASLLFLIALLARLAAMGRYVTPDELNWVYRSLGLRRALLTADWSNTIQSGHPGVTTTWIGALSIQLQQWLRPELQARLAWLSSLQQLSADNVEAFRHLYAFLTGGRLGVALVAGLGLALLYLHGRHIFGAPAAFLGALLLALDPFFAGLSGLLHVDALLATFSLLALLFALRAAAGGSPALAAASGAAAGLALLTKTPGLLAVLFTPLIFLWPMVRHVTGNRRPPATAKVRRTVSKLAVWAAALALSLLLLPALWSNPEYVLDTVRGLSSRLVEDAVRPTFFMGQMALDHGPVFYPVVLFFRLSPVAFVGVALTVLAALRRDSNTTAAGGARWLLLFAVVFLVAISVATKKFDRYALPALVALTYVAAWGLAQAAAWLRERAWGKGIGRRVWITAVVLQLTFLTGAWPHPLTAYNWLAGGNVVARQVFPGGWGEDAGAAARQISVTLDQPEHATLFTSSLTGTAPFFPGDIVRLREANLTRLQADDFLLSLAQDRQSPALPLPAGVAAPWDTFAVKGAGEAWLYRGLQPADLQLPTLTLEQRDVRFGAALALRASGSAFLPWPQNTIVALSWQRNDGAADVAPAYRLQLELVNEVGQVSVHREMPLLNAADQAPHDWPVASPQTVYYTIALPATLAPDMYDWIVRLFDDQGRQQAVFDAAGAFAGTQASAAAIAVTAPPEQPPPDMPHSIAGGGPLAGHGALPQSVTAGDPLELDVWWRAEDNEVVTLVLLAGEYELPFSLEVEAWREGQVYRLRPRWRLSPELPGGAHLFQLVARDETDGRVIAGPIALGNVQVGRRDLRNDLPQTVTPLQVQAGDLALLQDVSVTWQEEQLLVQLAWQALEPTFTNYTTFMHLRDGEQVIAADDRQPIPATSRWVAGEVILETYTLPRPAPGAYRIALGLYDPANGARLPLRDATGERFEEDAYVLVVEAP